MALEFKEDYRDGTTHVVFEPLDFLARLAALVGDAVFIDGSGIELLGKVSSGASI